MGDVVGDGMSILKVPTITKYINELTPHPENYNSHPASQIKELAESLSTFGQFKNIVTWTCPENMTTPEGHELHEGLTYILAGHGLWLAAMEAGVDELEVKDYSGLSYDMAIGLLLVDNAAPLGSEPDAQRLAALLARTREMTADRPSLGAMLERLKERAGINGNGHEPKDAEPQIDKAAELQKVWGVKVGDVWELGRHRLYVADVVNSRENLGVLLRGESVGLVVTDPPFTFGLASTMKGAAKVGGWVDLMNSAQWFASWYSLVDSVLDSKGAMWTCCSWRSFPVVAYASDLAKWGITSLLIWDKDWIGPGGNQGLRPSYEMVALFCKDDFAIPNRGINDIWTIPWSSHKPTGHAAEKPVDLFVKIIEESGNHEIVLDLFGGSGTTVIACEILGRKARVAELSPSYAALIIQRFVDFTGQTPRRLEAVA